MVIEILDKTRANAKPTGYVHVRVEGEHTDREIAEAAGLDRARHFGFDITRHSDPAGCVTVRLWND